MSTLNSPDDRLLQNLLAESEAIAPTASSSIPHPDDETLLLFSQHALPDEVRGPIVDHLSQCATCRQTVSHLLRLDAERDSLPLAAPGLETKTWSTVRITAFALAACLLVALGIVMFGPGGNQQVADARFYNEARQSLEHGDFDRAQAIILDAKNGGVQSDRLLSIEAQAQRRLPVAIALSAAGRLTQFGYDINGTMTKDFEPLPVAKGAQEALNVLKSDQSTELEAVLNRGHALLSLGRSEPALSEFKHAIELDSKNAYAWLGRGLAEFKLDDYAAAEQSFREAQRLDPTLVAAQMNVAITLAEDGRRGEALEVWQKLNQLPLNDEDSAAVRKAIRLFGNR